MTSTGEEVVKEATNRDVIVLDLENPGIGGEETARQIMKDSNARIILMGGIHEVYFDKLKKILER